MFLFSAYHQVLEAIAWPQVIGFWKVYHGQSQVVHIFVFPLAYNYRQLSENMPLWESGINFCHWGKKTSTLAGSGIIAILLVSTGALCCSLPFPDEPSKN